MDIMLRVMQKSGNQLYGLLCQLLFQHNVLTYFEGFGGSKKWTATTSTAGRNCYTSCLNQPEFWALGDSAGSHKLLQRKIRRRRM